MTVGRARIGPRHGPRARSPRRGRLGTQGGRAAFLGTGPTAWYDTRDLLTTTQQTLTNRMGVSTAQLGATAGVDATDPAAITHPGYTILWVPHVAANYCQKTVSAPTTPTSVEAIVRIRHDATPALTRYMGTGSTHLDVRVTTGGQMVITHLDDASGLIGNGAGSAANIPNWATNFGNWYWLKWAVTTAGVTTYAYSLDTTTTVGSVTWIPLTGGTGNAGTGVFHTAQQSRHTVGSYSTGLAPGQAFNLSYSKITWSGGETRTFDTATEFVTGAETTTVGGYTVARSTTGHALAAVTRPILSLDGTDDYLQLPAGDIPTFTATTGTHTVLVVARNRALAASGTLWSSESASNNGANLFLTSTGVVTARVGGATTTADATVGTGHDDDVTLNAFALVYSTGTVRAYRYGTAISATTDTTGVGTVTHASAPRVGSRADSAAVLDRAEIVAAVHYTRALTQAELDTASAFLTGTYV